MPNRIKATRPTARDLRATACRSRPVVVCQHGLEGSPADVINEDRESAAWWEPWANASMPSTFAQTATILAVGRKPSGESRAFSALDRAACAATATKVDGIGLTPSG